MNRIMLGALSFLLVNFAAIGVPKLCAGYRGIDGGKQNGPLRVITLAPGKVEAEYRTDDDKGVCFLSEVKGDLHILLISTLRGEQLYRSYSPHGTDTLVSLMGENFLATMDGSTLSSQGFFVPTASVRVVEEALQANVKVVAAALADGAPQYQSISLMRQ